MIKLTKTILVQGVWTWSYITHIWNWFIFKKSTGHQENNENM